jgi:hypothetical protein
MAEEDTMRKVIWTVLGFLVAWAAIVPAIVEAKLAANHNETLLRDADVTVDR